MHTSDKLHWGAQGQKCFHCEKYILWQFPPDLKQTATTVKIDKGCVKKSRVFCERKASLQQSKAVIFNKSRDFLVWEGLLRRYYNPWCNSCHMGTIRLPLLVGSRCLPYLEMAAGCSLRLVKFTRFLLKTLCLFFITACKRLLPCACCWPAGYHSAAAYVQRAETDHPTLFFAPGFTYPSSF